MPMPPPRTAHLVLVDPAGTVLGRLPPVPVATPWWQDVGPVLDAARSSFGVELVVLRLLASELPRPQGGGVTYLAEPRGGRSIPTGLPLEPWTADLADHPLRQAWARPGGPDADLAWARVALARIGRPLTGPPRQVRSWNLSSLWRLPLEDGDAWLKVVPPFFAHEGDVLARLAGRPVPELLAREGARMALAGIAGDDRYDARGPELNAMVTALVDIQREWAGRIDELLALGLPDWRSQSLSARIADTVERTANDLPRDDLDVLRAFVADLESRLAQLADVGPPDTLVHGDFHPGNVRGDGTRNVLLDWGDAGVGNPLLDLPAFLDRVPRKDVKHARARWLGHWAAAGAGDIDLAARLAAPLAAARQATVYRMFLDRIEPSEAPYHAADPADWLHRTAVLLREEG